MHNDIRVLRVKLTWFYVSCIDCEEKEEIVGETEIVIFVFQAWQCRALIS